MVQYANSCGDAACGRGAMIAVEITKPGTDTPDPEMTSKVAKLCHDEGVLVLTAGTYSNAQTVSLTTTSPGAIICLIAAFVEIVIQEL